MATQDTKKGKIRFTKFSYRCIQMGVGGSTYLVRDSQLGESRLDLDSPRLLQRPERRVTGGDELRVADLLQLQQNVDERRTIFRLDHPAHCIRQTTVESTVLS